MKEYAALPRKICSTRHRARDDLHRQVDLCISPSSIAHRGKYETVPIYTCDHARNDSPEQQEFLLVFLHSLGEILVYRMECNGLQKSSAEKNEELEALLAGHMQSVQGRERQDKDVYIKQDGKGALVGTDPLLVGWTLVHHEIIPCFSNARGTQNGGDDEVGEIDENIGDDSDPNRYAHFLPDSKDLVKHRQYRCFG